MEELLGLGREVLGWVEAHPGETGSLVGGAIGSIAGGVGAPVGAALGGAAGVLIDSAVRGSSPSRRAEGGSQQRLPLQAGWELTADWKVGPWIVPRGTILQKEEVSD